MKFERIVTFEMSTGSTNAYRSVLSATGSFEIVGASRWDDIGAHLVYVVRRITSPGSLVTISCVPHITTTVPVAASFTYAITGAFMSPGGGLACTFSVIFRIVGAAVIAPTAAAPTAVFCRKLRLDIFDFFASAIRFPSVRVREENSSRTFSGPPDRLEGYFDMCNIACYNPRRSTGPRQSSRPDRRSDPTGEKTHIRWPPLLPNGSCMNLLNARRIGTNDKKKRTKPMPINATPTCRSRDPDSPKNVAPAGEAALGPATMLPPTQLRWTTTR